MPPISASIDPSLAVPSVGTTGCAARRRLLGWLAAGALVPVVNAPAAVAAPNAATPGGVGSGSVGTGSVGTGAAVPGGGTGVGTGGGTGAAVPGGMMPGGAAQRAWPERPIRLVVPFPPGGTTDNVGRIVADALATELGVAVVVENKPGGTTQLGTDFVAHAVPDGQTLLMGAATAFTVLPHLRRKLPYDPKNGFEYLGGIAEYLAIVAVRNDLGVKSLRQLLALAKEQPDKLSYGSAGIASVGHIAGGTLQRETGVRFLHVPFKGSADAVNALAGGQVDFVIDGAAVALARSGRITPLAVFGNQKHPGMPELPTLDEAGIQVRTQRTSSWGLFAPKGTPAEVNVRLAEALKKAMARPEIRERFTRTSTLADWRSPADLRAAMDSDYRFNGELLPAIGIRPED